MSNQQLPAFTPVPATPVPPPFAGNEPNGKGVRQVKPKAAKKTLGKSAKATKKAAAAHPGTTPRVRRSRVAPLQMDAAQALNALAGLSKKEVESLQALIALLNPLPRPARRRVLTSVASLLEK